MQTEESKIFAEAQARSKASYDAVKDSEYGGTRDLPGGLEGICMLTSSKLGKYKSGKNEGKAFITLYRHVVEPEEYSGTYCGETVPIEETSFGSEEENQGRVIGILKKFGYEQQVLANHSFWALLNEVLSTLGDDRRTCGFEVSQRTNRNGEHYFNLTDPTPDNYQLPSYFKHPADRGSKKNVKPKGSTQSQPAKKGAPAKKGQTKGAKGAKGACPFAKDDKVIVDASKFEDGNAYPGTVQSINVNHKTCEVFFPDDESTMTIEWSLMTVDDGSLSSEPTWQIGDRIRSTNNHFGDNTDYEGEIKSLSDSTALVTWDDETESEIPFENIVVPS